MPKICYVDKKFRPESLLVIQRANEICSNYKRQGYDLTLRQLYYQYVSRGWIPNSDSEYKKLGSIINDARLAGELDWDYIEDRSRNLQKNAHWKTPGEIVAACAEQYQIDKWQCQRRRVEVWVEKEALVGIVARACEELDVPYFACKGYVSQSEMHSTAIRLRRYERGLNPQDTVILHLGDHDPSGIDMTRDIRDRLEMFGSRVDVRRIALNINQVREYNPPPNPAKLTDSRCKDYVANYGDESWELDALDPSTLDDLIREEVKDLLWEPAWDMAVMEENKDRARLQAVAETMDR